MSNPQIPRPADLLTPFIDAICALRPGARYFFDRGIGNWSKLLEGLRGQARINLLRLASEAAATRLPLATGGALRELAKSEYETVLPSDPQYARASVTITRAGSFGYGVVRAGSLWAKAADPNAQPVPIQSAEYRTLATVSIGTDIVVTIPLIATRPGVHANIPITKNAVSTLIQPSTPLFDKGHDFPFSVAACSAAGGSSGIDDPTLREAAKAYAFGQYGPTKGAAIAGALRTQSVRRFYLSDFSDTTAAATLYVADESWSSAAQWGNYIAQTINSSFLGFGCRVVVGAVCNQYVRASATVRLKRSEDLQYTADIDAAISAALAEYFNGRRQDWYRWRASTLRAIVSRADPRILLCSSVTLEDAIVGGALLTEPPVNGAFSAAGELVHYYLADRALVTTYLPPL